MVTLEELRRQTGAALCVECGKCTASCPLAGFSPFSPRALAAADDLECRENGLVGRCLACGACEVRCPQGVHFIEYVKGRRALLPESARLPCPHDAVFDSAARRMISNRPIARDMSWIEDDMRIAERGEVALFVGCLPLFEVFFKQELDVNPMDIARSAIRVLNYVGIEPVIVPAERCCGHDQLFRGDRETFAQLAKANTRVFADKGVKHILTTCAECCRTWRLDFPEVVPEYRPKVQHLAEFVAECIDRGEITFSDNGRQTIAYQDACRLGRHLGIYDPPRKVLDAVPGTTRREMDRTPQDAQCCGTSGFIHCDANSRRMQVKRLERAENIGAEKIITTCPKCMIHLTCAQAENYKHSKGESPTLKIEDFSVLLGSRLSSKLQGQSGTTTEKGGTRS